MNEKKTSDDGLRLKKVAFVAMPFGIKATGLPAGKGPTQVDFDALWENALSPALSKLKYLPIRADNRTGSVIIKDMLEQLVHADLVLADVSIPNGNVCYEAAVRHAARNAGCILLYAEWAKLLFDLAQITQLRYPFPLGEPTESDYRSVKETLVKRIPALVDSVGPVFTLTRFDPAAPQDSRKLTEIFSEVFEFQNRLGTARLAAEGNQKSDLRRLMDPALLKQLPGYALRDLTAAVRDHLSWGDLSSLIHALPEAVFDDPFFREQEANALARQGRYYDAVALLDTIIDTYGPTPERSATVGGLYRELAGDEQNKAKKRQYAGKAIKAYRRGMQLDLNGYHCAQKLLISLVERGRASDREEARQCATVARYAAHRTAALNPKEQWVDATLAVLAFFERDTDEARDRVDAILDRGWTNRKLVGLVQDLESLLGRMDEQERGMFKEMIGDLAESLPIAQDVLMNRVLPMIHEANSKYRKFQQVHARAATANEVIVSTTSDGEETNKTAAEGEVVVKNLTEAQEQ